MKEIVNNVAKSSLVLIDLNKYLHVGARVVFDLKDMLFQERILREKDFRELLKVYDWTIYSGKNVGLTCSVEAIVPIWAYMLLVTKIKEYANLVTFGEEEAIEKALIDQAIEQCFLSNSFEGMKVVIKGCGNIKNTEYAYTAITEKIFPKVNSLMYGEPCSTVPIFKRKK